MTISTPSSLTDNPAPSSMNAQPRPLGPIALISLYVVENNGVRFLASSLRKSGFQVIEIYLKDYKHHNFVPPTPKELHLLADILRQNQVSLIGLSVRAGGYLRCAAEVTAFLKSQFQVPIIWGGMHVTMGTEECLQFTDYAMVGECEKALVQAAHLLLHGESLADAPNMWSRQADGTIRRNALLPLVEDLDNLPWRDFHSHECKYWIDGNRVTKGDPYVSETVYLMMTARGCLFNCSFCDVSALRKVFKGLGTFYRTSSPQRVVAECLYAKQHFPKLRRFRFDDELFCMKIEWVEEFCRLYREQIGMPFDLLSDPRVIAEPQLRLLKAAGCDTIMMGVQNTSAVNARLYNRKVSDEQMIEATRIIHRVGLKPCYQILLDDPHLTGEDKQNLFNLLIRFVRPYDLYLFSLSYWPRTDITEKYIADGTITWDDVEGRNDKCLRQFHVDLAWPRPPEDMFWDSLFTLLSKPIVPLNLVVWLSKRDYLRRHPLPLLYFAQALNLGKLAWLAFGALVRGELTINTIKRWVNWKSLATS